MKLSLLFRAVLTLALGEDLRSVSKGMLLFFVLVSMSMPVAHAATAPNLGPASSYAVFGKAGVTNDSAVGITHIWGNVGADASVTNLDDVLQVDGAINTPAIGIEAAILSAYGELAGEGVTGILDLAGSNTVVPGVYDIGATTLNGALTLNGAGVYIFRSSSSISTSGPAIVQLTNGASACNVFWQIPASMTIGAGTQMVGTIITDTGLISLAAGASLKGRALSLISAVTLDSNQVTEPLCASASSSSQPGAQQLRRPIISVLKVPEPLALAGPGLVTYTFHVSNPGFYTMNTITLTDEKCSPIDYVSGDINNDALLQTNEVWTYRCTAFVSKDTFNEARATGLANGLSADDIGYATVRVGTRLPPPLIHVVKKPDVSVLPFGGGKVTYTYTLNNPGVVALHYVQVSDDKCADVQRISGDRNGNRILDTDETWIYHCQANIALTTTNTVTVTGNANNETATDIAVATVVVAPPAETLSPPQPLPPVHIPSPVVPPEPAPLPVPMPEVILLPMAGVGFGAVVILVFGVLLSALLTLLTRRKKHRW